MSPHSLTLLQREEVMQGDGSCSQHAFLVFPPALDLAPGVDEIYEESKEVFLTPGHPQDGQVVFYKVGSLHSCLCSPVFSSASRSGAVRCLVPAPWLCIMFVSYLGMGATQRGQREAPGLRGS